MVNLRVRNALDKCSTNVMIADATNEIVYMNDTVREMMGRNEARSCARRCLNSTRAG